MNGISGMGAPASASEIARTARVLRDEGKFQEMLDKRRSEAADKSRADSDSAKAVNITRRLDLTPYVPPAPKQDKYRARKAYGEFISDIEEDNVDEESLR